MSVFTDTDSVYGTDAADSPVPGTIGEFIFSTVSAGSTVSLTTSGTAYNIASMTLGPGDWDVRGQIQHSAGTNTSVTKIISGISSTSATTAGQAGGNGIFPEPTRIMCMAAGVPNGVMSQDVGPFRLSTDSSTTMYLIAQDTFTVSTFSAYGTISARRAR